MTLIYKNKELLKLAEEKGLNLANIAQDMVLVCYKKGDLIIDYGESNQNYYLLKRGTLKVTECEPGSSSFGQPDTSNRRVRNVHYVSNEGHGFFGSIFDIHDGVHYTTIEAMDEKCEVYVLEKIKREQLKDTDMAKRIHQVLYMNE